MNTYVRTADPIMQMSPTEPGRRAVPAPQQKVSYDDELVATLTSHPSTRGKALTLWGELACRLSVYAKQRHCPEASRAAQQLERAQHIADVVLGRAKAGLGPLSKAIVAALNETGEVLIPLLAGGVRERSDTQASLKIAGHFVMVELKRGPQGSCAVTIFNAGLGTENHFPPGTKLALQRKIWMKTLNARLFGQHPKSGRAPERKIPSSLRMVDVPEQALSAATVRQLLEMSFTDVAPMPLGIQQVYNWARDLGRVDFDSPQAMQAAQTDSMACIYKSTAAYLKSCMKAKDYADFKVAVYDDALRELYYKKPTFNEALRHKALHKTRPQPQVAPRDVKLLPETALPFLREFTQVINRYPTASVALIGALTQRMCWSTPHSLASGAMFAAFNRGWLDTVLFVGASHALARASGGGDLQDIAQAGIQGCIMGLLIDYANVFASTSHDPIL